MHLDKENPFKINCSRYRGDSNQCINKSVEPYTIAQNCIYPYSNSLLRI